MRIFKLLPKKVLVLACVFQFVSCAPGYIRITSETSIDEVRELIKRGADVNMIDPVSMAPPLHRAVLHGHPDIVSLLIDAGADVNARTDHGSTTLIMLARTRNVRIIEAFRLLIEAGADVNMTTDDGTSALVEAFFFSNWVLVHKFLEAGADVQALDQAWGMQNRIREQGWVNRRFGQQDMSQRGFITAIVSQGEKDILLLLLERGINLKDERWPHLIFSALRNLDMLQFFVEAGMDVYVEQHRMTLLAEAIFVNRNAALWLIEQGINVNHVSASGFSALMQAASLGDIELAALLIEAGADVNHMDTHGNTALTHASVEHWDRDFDEEMVTLLINAGADESKIWVRREPSIYGEFW